MCLGYELLAAALLGVCGLAGVTGTSDDRRRCDAARVGPSNGAVKSRRLREREARLEKFGFPACMAVA